MKYNAEKPIAVFLGPSLEQARAVQILAANYYPPARMGDVYRLLGSGVRMILLIDGIFHHQASVWQRELLEAIDNDICVIGAASMGALRAAELHDFGMLGHGTIFEWYQAGIIEGDDEVALNHADAAWGYRPFSEPLVNIRYNLQRAVAKKCVSSQQGTALLEFAQATYYADRSYAALMNSPLVKDWPPEVQDRLGRFIQHEAVNLKHQDAVSVLKYCASMANDTSHPSSPVRAPRSQGRYYRMVRYRNRGFLHPAGVLVSGESLLAKVRQDGTLINSLRTKLIKNHFLLLWAQQNEITCPADYLEAFRQTWELKYLKTDEAGWLRANGLTKREFQAALAERALLTWLIEQEPAFFGLDVTPFRQLAEMLLSATPAHQRETVQAGQQQANLLRQTAEICYLSAWIGENGVTCPPVYVEKFIERWEESYQLDQRTTRPQEIHLTEAYCRTLLGKWASVNWLIEKGPAYFGYTSWSFEVALLKELQITGQAARYLTEISQR